MPQLLKSLFVFVHAGGVPHTVLPGFVAGFGQQRPLTFTRGSLQHSPLEHVWPVPHTWPPPPAHAPQFASSLCASTHWPPQLISFDLQQTCDVPEVLHDVFGDCVVQLLLHEPHVAASVMSVQTPPQLI